MSDILNSDNPISAAFLDYRLRTGLSQVKAAAIFCNRNVKRWRAYEKGKSLPTKELSLMMLRLTQVPTEVLIADLEVASAYMQRT